MFEAREQYTDVRLLVNSPCSFHETQDVVRRLTITLFVITHALIASLARFTRRRMSLANCSAESMGSHLAVSGSNPHASNRMVGSPVFGNSSVTIGDTTNSVPPYHGFRGLPLCL